MFLLLLSWLYIIVLSLPLGWAGQRWSARFFTVTKSEPPDFLDAILLGLAAISTFLAYFSLFFAINMAANTVVLAAAGGCFWRFGNDVKSAFLQQKPRLASCDRWHVGGLILAAALALAYALQVPQVYDSALYHVQSIRWATEYPALPGLGNVHGRLAFNAHFFLLCALFDGSWLGLANGFPLNGLVTLLLLWRIGTEMSRALARRDSGDFAFYFLAGAFALFFLVKIVHSPTPDAFVAVLVWWIVIWIKKHYAGQAGYLVTPIALCFLAPTVKLSALFALFFLPVFLPISWRNVLKISVIGAVMLLPFLLRNYVLSGWLVYPFPAVDVFQVDWKVPIEQVFAEKQFIECWSRVFAYDTNRTLAMPLREWLPAWWAAQSGFWKMVLLLNGLSVPLLLVLWRRKAATWEMGLLAALLLNVAFWFKTAPDPRFAAGFLSANAAWVLSLLLGYALVLPEKKRVFGMQVAVAVLLLAAAGLTMLKFKSLKINDLYQPRAMEQVAARHYNWTGLPLWVPEVGERCFDCPIPCAPQVNERLRLRGAQVRDGFRVQ